MLFSLYFLSRICSYTFKFRTIVRSFSQYVRRAFVLEYSFQVSGLLAPIATRPSKLGAVIQRFNHYESSVAEHVRIWSKQSFIEAKLGAFTQVYFSIFHLKQATQPVFSLLVFRLCFSCVIRIKQFPYFGAMFLFSNFFGRNWKWFGQLVRIFWANGKPFQNLFVNGLNTTKTRTGIKSCYAFVRSFTLTSTSG